MAAPSADEPAEDQRCQNGEYKKDKSGVDRTVLYGEHRLGRLDRRNSSTHEPPLNDVSDHEQVEGYEGRRAPAAGP